MGGWRFVRPSDPTFYVAFKNMAKVQGLSTETEKKHQLQPVIVPKTNATTVKAGPPTEIKKVTQLKFCRC